MQKPANQVLLFILLTPVVILVVQPKSAEAAWSTAAIVFSVFLILNAGFLWFAVHPWRYFFYSLLFAVIYLVVIVLVMRVLFKVLSLKESGESAMAFLIIIYQPPALLLVMFVKWIVTKWF